MVIVLKVILFLLLVAEYFVSRFMLKDYLKAKKSEHYDSLSIWNRLVFNSTFFFTATALISLAVFFVVFIVSNIQIV